MTASFSASLAPSKPATSSHFTFGFSVTMAPASAPFSLLASASALSSPCPLDAVAAPPPAPPCASLSSRPFLMISARSKYRMACA